MNKFASEPLPVSCYDLSQCHEFYTDNNYIPRIITPDRWRIYVAGPLSAPTAEERAANIARADYVGKQIFLKGHYPFVPHKQAETWFEETNPLFQDYDALVADHDILGWLMICDAVIFIGEWEASRGSQMEFKAAIEAGKRIFFHLVQIPDVRSK